jgi:hypothetical protein
MSCEEDDSVLLNVWALWTMQVRASKEDGDCTKELKWVQERLASFEKTAAENAKKVMTRLAGNCDGALRAFCFQAWVECGHNSHQDKELEEAVKKTEADLKKRFDAKKNETRDILAKMTGSCSVGTLALIVQLWVEVVHEEKFAREVHTAVSSQENRYQYLTKQRRLGNFRVQNRINEQTKMNLFQRVYSVWYLETKVNTIDRVFTRKYITKKNQLQGVQNLFKSFAMQLEQNLGGDEDETMLITNRHSSGPPTGVSTQRRHKHQQRGMVKDSAGSVSLPDIVQSHIHHRTDRALLS